VRKALREMFLDFKSAGEYGIYLPRGACLDTDHYIHKAFNCAMWADGVGRYVTKICCVYKDMQYYFVLLLKLLMRLMLLLLLLTRHMLLMLRM